MRPPARGTSIPCPRCGGDIGVTEDAGALVCPFCAAAFYLEGTLSAGWIVEPALALAQAAPLAVRWLREQHRAIDRIGPVRGVLAPFHWIRGRCCAWEIASLPEPAPTPAAHCVPLEPRLSIRSFCRAVPAHPVSEFVRGGATRLESSPLDLLDPDRLPAGYEILPVLKAEGAPRGSVSRTARGGAGDARDRATAVIEERRNLVLFPVVLVGGRSPDGESFWVVIDALSARAQGEMPETAGSAPVPASILREPALRMPRLLPLECRACGAALQVRERDRLHPCANCEACWEVAEGTLRRVRQWELPGDPGPRGRRLPFWVFGGADGDEMFPDPPFFAPAYGARHPEEQIRLAARLCETPPSGTWGPPGPWPEEGASVGSREARAWRWGVEGALARVTLAGFLKFLHAPRVTAEPPRGLAWIPFTREGGDLVEPTTGARVRAVGVDPWPSLPAAA